MVERTLEQIEADIKSVQTKLDKLNKKLAKGKELSALETRNKALFEKNLDGLLKEKESLTKKTVVAPTTDSKNTITVSTTDTPITPVTPSSTEKRLENVEEKAQEAADEMNSEEDKNKKTEDAKSAAETAKNRAAQIDANVEENVPTWFWREAQEMAPSSKAKRGFIISNHILNRLGTAIGNVGAIVQNAGGSGGASLKEHGGS